MFFLSPADMTALIGYRLLRTYRAYIEMRCYRVSEPEYFHAICLKNICFCKATQGNCDKQFLSDETFLQASAQKQPKIKSKENQQTFIFNLSKLTSAKLSRADICHQHHQQRQCKKISTRVKFHISFTIFGMFLVNNTRKK